ncbi:MAG: hypothetical protein AB7J34_01975 [Limisphaerales bacterium]
MRPREFAAQNVAPAHAFHRQKESLIARQPSIRQTRQFPPESPLDLPNINGEPERRPPATNKTPPLLDLILDHFSAR